MTNEILWTNSIRDFFGEAVKVALRDHLLSPGEATTGYVIDLLCKYVTAQMADLLEQPLGIVLAKARKAKTDKALEQLKRVGDHSLYLRGFFEEYIQKRQIDPEYYDTLGESAYRRLGRILGNNDDDSRLSGVFFELSDDFSNFVKVLAQIRQHQTNHKSDLGNLYERWLETKSSKLEAELRASGMVLPNGNEGSDN